MEVAGEVRKDLVIVNQDLCRNLCRKYIVRQLNRNNLNEIASCLPEVQFLNNPAHAVVHAIADALEEESGTQIEQILETLDITAANLEERYDLIMHNLFKDTINWGKIFAYIALSARMVVYCTKSEELQSRIPSLVTLTETVMESRLHQWIERQGGFEPIYSTKDLIHLSQAVQTILFNLSAIDAAFK